jgi:hypothetical protein
MWYAPSMAESGVEGPHAATEPSLCRACFVCRAGFAGRGTAVARATRRLMLAVSLRPDTKSWVGIIMDTRGQLW